MFEQFVNELGVDVTEFLILSSVSFLGSFITVALGIGGGVLVLATMAQILPPTVLIPIHGVVQFGSNIGRAVLMRKNILFRIVPIFLIGTILGALLGAKLVISFPTPVLQSVLGLFVLYSVWIPKFKASNPSKKTFLIVGFLASITTMFVGATGILIASFSNAACPDRQQYVATHATLMTLQHGFKVVAFGLLGFAFGPYLPLLCSLIACGYAGTWCGKHVLVRIPEKIFKAGLKIILTLLALRLLYDALHGYLN